MILLVFFWSKYLEKWPFQPYKIRENGEFYKFADAKRYLQIPSNSFKVLHNANLRFGVMGVDLGRGGGGDIYPPLFRQGV